MKESELKRNCENCVHRDLSANSDICRDCWNYQRWKNWEHIETEDVKKK